MVTTTRTHTHTHTHTFPLTPTTEKTHTHCLQAVTRPQMSALSPVGVKGRLLFRKHTPSQEDLCTVFISLTHTHTHTGCSLMTQKSTKLARKIFIDVKLTHEAPESFIRWIHVFTHQ